MKNFIQPNAVRPGLLAASAVALAAAAAAGTGIAAGPGSAAPAANAAHPPKVQAFKKPKVKHGALQITGTKAGDRIALRLKAGNPDVLQVDVGDDGSPDFSFPRNEITEIAIEARDGDDSVRIDESFGLFTDTIPTTIDGGDGDDRLAGGAGAETLIGGEGNDSIDGNRGNDVARMDSGDDTFVWDPGDGSDVVEGNSGDDTMLFNGANIAENVDLSANGSRLRFVRDVGTITMDVDGVETVDFNALGGADTINVRNLEATDVTSVQTDLGVGDAQTDRVSIDGTNGNDAIDVSGDASAVAVSGLPALVSISHHEPTDKLAVNGLAGNDAISAANLAAGAIALTLDGGEGNDTIAGAKGVEVALGGDGNDTIDGNGGNDTAFMGAGDDTFVWDPGDGSDVVEGQDGTDTMVFNGANIAEQVDLSANGQRLRFFRNPGNITMDTNGVETVDFNALGGADTVNVSDLTGTDVTTVNNDLAASGGGGDGQADHVIVNGTSGADRIGVAGGSGAASVTGLPAVVNLRDAEPANDTLTINALAGADNVDASGLAATSVKLELNGGDDADRLAGSAGGDLVNGGRAADIALMGAGDDTFVWNPGDGSDTVEGQSGVDTMLFNGANIAESIDLSANGGRLRFTRDIANITMDTDDVETVDFKALGGADTINVGDLTGTDVKNVKTDLGAAGGGGDGAADHVIVAGTSGNDAIVVTGDSGTANVTGLPAAVSLTNAEPANDTLTINALAGADTVDASGLAATSVKLELNGGDDADTLTGSAGGDLVNGGRAADTALMGAGDDTFVWNPGDGSDTVEGQSGADTMLFNGANIAESIDLSANGSRLRFTRDIANVTMDTNGVESVDFNALGGADLVTVNDLAGTGVGRVNVDLAATISGDTGDGQPDDVVVNGTNGGDAITINGGAGSATTGGLAAVVAISHAEPAHDTLTVKALAGDDVAIASGLASSSLVLTLDGGTGDDVLVGSAGNDVLFGREGDDILLGGPGLDVLDGGPGNNVLIQD